jgi:hypothetical protein
MVEIEEVDRPPPRVVDAAAHNDHQQQNVVSNGETSATGELDDYEDMFSATDDEDAEDSEVRARYHRNRNRTNKGTGKDLFYDENLDEEDEAYVYKHMRGGIRENVTLHTTISNKGPVSTPISWKSSYHGNGTERVSASDNRQQKVQMFKPRHSDAVLSCPCCFNIVCMDCQKHKRYANQYRAMFVMGVVVDWKHILVYDEIHRALVSKIEQPNAIEIEQEEEPREWHDPAEGTGSNNEILPLKDGEYYAVECATCRTQVAALDMKDEVYYFHGCLESSSAF